MTFLVAPTERLPWRRSLKTRIALWFGVLAALAAAGGGIALHKDAQHRALADAEAAALRETRRASAEMRALLRAVEVSAATLVRAQQSLSGDTASTKALLDALVASEPNTTGGFVALNATSDTAAWSHYIVKSGRDTIGIDTPFPVFVAAASEGMYWSAPAFNATVGGRWTIRLSLPIRDSTGGVVGHAGLDISIDRFSLVLAPVRDDPRLRAAIHKNTMWIGDSAWASLSTSPPNSHVLDTWRTRLHAANVNADDLALHKAGPDTRGLYESLGDGWGVLVVVDDGATLAELRDTTLQVIVGIASLIALLALLGNAVARGVTRPLVQLSRSAQRLAQQGFVIPASLLARRDELGQLAHALHNADAALRQQMASTQHLAQEQQKFDSEMRLAHDLQQSMLPLSTAVDAHEGRIDIHALLKPAKSVGGDFYAFHPREDSMLWFAIGDISDKGVPAALFMARTVAVLEATARSTDSPALMLARAAPRLAEGNESCMFATTLCGLIDPHTGLFELASSGHEPPFLIRADGHIERFEMETGAPLGIDPEAYGEGFAGMLAPGDVLFCFTDGVTEARSRDGALFGEERLRALLAKPGRRAEQIVAEVLAAVDAFSAGAEPADDITVLAVGLVAAQRPARDPLRYSVWPAGLRAMNNAIDECLASHGVPSEGRSDVRLVLEELIANALDHGGAIECTVDLALAERTITLTIIDDGAAFNPLDSPDPVLDADDPERPIGGLGLHLIKTLSLDAAYAREGPHNQLTLLLPRNPPT